MEFQATFLEVLAILAAIYLAFRFLIRPAQKRVDDWCDDVDEARARVEAAEQERKRQEAEQRAKAEAELHETLGGTPNQTPQEPLDHVD